MFVFLVIFTSTAFYTSTSEALTPLPPPEGIFEEPNYETENPRSLSSFAKASASSSSSWSSSAFASASSSSSSSDEPNSSIFNRCTPTCSIPNPSNCPESTTRNDGCSCESGYILSEKGGECVKLEECQKYLNCDGDRNATHKECPIACAPTCSNPNAIPCKTPCKPGCQCNPLYILSDEEECILPADCPGGNPCGQNKTFVYCSVKCPNTFCPENDNRGIIACSPPYPCPSGCSCQANYKRLRDEDRCILASDCPPVNCTRQNEVWNSCPPPCFKESCRDLNTPPRECIIRYGPYCEPQCVCNNGYRRNNSDICVPVSECRYTSEVVPLSSGQDLMMGSWRN